MTRAVASVMSLWLVLASVGCEDDAGGMAPLDAAADIAADVAADMAADIVADLAVDVSADTSDVAVEVSADTGDGPAGLADRAVDAAEVAPGCGCAADELCVQLNDGTCQGLPTLVTCRKVSAACRAETAKIIPVVAGSCYMVSAACALEYCPQPYQCNITPPCGNETASATVWCYGP